MKINGHSWLHESPINNGDIINDDKTKQQARITCIIDNIKN